MYKIGDFSKVVDLPVRTLRYYDETGVLTPSEIDTFTGYRYYSDEDIIECEFVKLLKSLDFTLEEIREYKDCLDEDIIEEKKSEIEAKMYLLQMTYDRLLMFQEELRNTQVSPSDAKSLILRNVRKEDVKEVVNNE